MTADSNLDFALLQRILSDAFAVQQSVADIDSLHPVGEPQRSIGTAELDAGQIMNRIAERVRHVAGATAVSVGLLKGDRLVYQAGSGTARSFVGREIPAMLSISAHDAAKGEILRVENAENDSRIEAAICRQFGARALLLLTIYRDRTMAGVLAVLFDEAHVFQDREVRIYRFMASLLGEVVSRAQRPRKKEVSQRDALLRQPIREVEARVEPSAVENESALTESKKGLTNEGSGNSTPKFEKLPVPSETVVPVSEPVTRIRLYKSRFDTLAAVAAMLVIACWVTIQVTTLGSPLLQPPLRTELFKNKTTSVQEEPVGTNVISEPAVKLSPKSHRIENAAKRVPLRSKDGVVGYSSDDVVVRYFRPVVAPRQVVVPASRVRYFSEDVTVRYFMPQPDVAPSMRSTEPQSVRH